MRGLPSPLRVDVDGKELRISVVAERGMVVVKDAEGVWTIFSRDREGAWDSDGADWNALGVGDLVELMLRSRKLYDSLLAVVETAKSDDRTQGRGGL